MIQGDYLFRGATIHGAVAVSSHIQIKFEGVGTPYMTWRADMWPDVDSAIAADVEGTGLSPIDSIIVRLQTDGAEGDPAIASILALIASQARSLFASGMTAADSDASLAGAMIMGAQDAMDDYLIGNHPAFAGWRQM